MNGGFIRVPLKVEEFKYLINVIQSDMIFPQKDQFFNMIDFVLETKSFNEAIKYKSDFQSRIIPTLTKSEMNDIIFSRTNQNVIYKLVKIAHSELVSLNYANIPYSDKRDIKSLYSLSIAIETIIEEYGWETDYLDRDGLYNLAYRVYNGN